MCLYQPACFDGQVGYVCPALPRFVVAAQYSQFAAHGGFAVAFTMLQNVVANSVLVLILFVTAARSELVQPTR
jgi:hypothetical protein